MLTHSALDSIVKGIAAASTLTEGNFLDIGQKLETSIATLGALTTTFERLFQELDSENMQQAGQDIRNAATRVVALAQAHGSEKDAVKRMGGLASTIHGGASAISNAVRNADLLAVSARIAAANLGEAGGDFADFANDIGRTLKLAQATLDRFRHELADTVRHLDAARTGQSAFDRDQNHALQAIPARLSASIDAIAEGSRRAAGAATAVQEKSRQVSQRIAEAVMALQIGDKTRQRIEHAEFALNVLREILGAGNGPGDWPDLDDAQRHVLLSLGCRLQAAQLTDAAGDLDRQAVRILSALNELGADARDILRLGNATYGGAETARGAFLLDLKDDVSQAHILLEGFRSARNSIDGAIAAVSQSGASLFGHISTVRSLEADIRIMGLNATLKCGRLGNKGRALSVVAQELRVYANQIAAEAGAVMAGLEHVVSAAGSLSDRNKAHGAEEIAAVAKTMTASVGRLGAAGESLADALAALQRDSAMVVSLLEDAVARMAVHQEIGRALVKAATDLASLVPEPSAKQPAMEPTQKRMLDMVSRTYTMAEERVVQDTVVRGVFAHVADEPRAPDHAGASPANVDDILF